jgi:hypothetical protein
MKNLKCRMQGQRSEEERLVRQGQTAIALDFGLESDRIDWKSGLRRQAGFARLGVLSIPAAVCRVARRRLRQLA